MSVIDAKDRFKKQEKPIEPVVSLLRRTICGFLNIGQRPKGRAEEKQKVKDGTHRFDIHPGQAIAADPQGFCIDLVEERKSKMERNAELIKTWENRYVVVTDDGYEVREMG
ncbi:MAG: hypothetical protein KAT58_12095 [candidate division Zixibacteria bacterium]|nr:hypothetical protein [candidate division Zixibacteria bacterium]